LWRFATLPSTVHPVQTDFDFGITKQASAQLPLVLGSSSITSNANMPRVTKKQKEAGKAPGSKVSHGGARGAQPERKKGFHVGPAHAAKDAYLGKGECGFFVASSIRRRSLYDTMDLRGALVPIPRGLLGR
jgi:hypothetical protein